MSEPTSIDRGMFDAALSSAIAYATVEIESLRERIYQLERRNAALDAENLRLREERQAASRATPSGSSGGSDG